MKDSLEKARHRAKAELPLWQQIVFILLFLGLVVGIGLIGDAVRVTWIRYWWTR